MDVRDAVFDQKLDQFVELNRDIQELSLLAWELSLLAWEPAVLDLIGDFVQRWNKRVTQLQLILYELSSDGQGKVLVRATIGRSCSRLHDTNDSNVQRTDRPGLPIKFDTLERGFVCISRPLPNEAALILETVSTQFPEFLSSFMLHISHLSSTGLEHVHNILRRSTLEQLRVRCTRFSPTTEESVFKVPESV